MASFRIKFPEKEEPSVIAFNGARLTVGRRPENTIQIIDRTISGSHAELIFEEDHYRLRDLGSSNGTFVDGVAVTDYHLREGCQVAFGTVECEFHPGTLSGGATAVETLPTHSEVITVRMENMELRARLEALQSEIEALRKARPMNAEEVTMGVSKEDFQKVADEREALQEEKHRHEREIARLQTDLALLQHDRANLQRAWDGTKAELAKARASAEASPPSAEFIESAAASAGSGAPAEPPPLAKPPTPFGAPRPLGLRSSAAPQSPASPGGPLKTPMPVRPVGKPLTPALNHPPASAPASAPTVKADLIASRPMPASVPANRLQPIPPVKGQTTPLLKPVAKLPTPTQAPAPKGGTQKIAEPSATSPVPEAPPQTPAQKLPPPKPPLKLGGAAGVPKAVPPKKGEGEAPAEP